MKTATLSPVRIDGSLRTAAESVLADGERLSSFMEASFSRTVEYHLVKADFAVRGQATIGEYRRTCVSYSAGEARRPAQATRAVSFEVRFSAAAFADLKRFYDLLFDRAQTHINCYYSGNFITGQHLPSSQHQDIALIGQKDWST